MKTAQLVCRLHVTIQSETQMAKKEVFRKPCRLSYVTRLRAVL